MSPQRAPARAPLDRLRLQVEVLFRIDPQRRLVAINQRSAPPAPRVFLGRTPTGNVWLVRRDLPQRTREALERRCSSEPVRSDLESEPQCAAGLRQLLERDAPVRLVHRGPAFRFPAEAGPVAQPPTRPHASPLQLPPGSAASRRRLERFFPSFTDDLHDSAPLFAIVQDGDAVAIACTARRSEAAAECGVETAADFRGRGYAGAIVGAWAQAIRREGAAPLYSTDWSNRASRRVAAKLGLILYGDDFHLT